MRLINAEVLLKKLKWLEEYDYVVFNNVKRTVDEVPTVDAIPVRHGHWIFNPKDAIEMMFTLPKCSVCGAESPNGGNYCPNCGAKMDGE